MSDNPLVYSTDKTIVSECTSNKPSGSVDPKKITAVLRMEKSGRNGKPVTVIDRLPKNEPFLHGLARDLKKKCGCGGTYKMDGEFGVVEIQGDKREPLRSELEKSGFRVKG